MKIILNEIQTQRFQELKDKPPILTDHIASQTFMHHLTFFLFELKEDHKKSRQRLRAVRRYVMKFQALCWQTQEQLKVAKGNSVEVRDLQDKMAECHDRLQHYMNLKGLEEKSTELEREAINSVKAYGQELCNAFKVEGPEGTSLVWEGRAYIVPVKTTIV
ncbi:hypothetical protein [Persicobacter sp. CCB-QB2]|uniref:hypothetical protein n=1 Tax=Persicobacter sp. CCB-QB2 TaxID=1561025 RepID=UPI0006A9C95D|nr:hypothetical protein [Persicobacter sp. CCB-QB2]